MRSTRMTGKTMHRWVMLGEVALVTSLVVGVQAQVHATEPVVPLANELGAPNRLGQPVDVSENYDKLSNSLFKREPELWGGAYVDGAVLVVKTVGRSVEEARWVLKSIGIKRGIAVVPASRSIEDLENLASSAMLDAPREVVAVGPQYATSRIAIGMSTDNPSYRAFLARLNSDAFVLYRTRGAQQTSRYFDTNPFYGGARIRMSSSTAAVNCSSGFAWNPTAGSAQLMITAAHCYAGPLGALPLVSTFTAYGATQIGKISWSSGGAAGTLAGRNGDIAVYALAAGLSSLNRTYVGSGDTSDSKVVIGRVTLPEGWKGSSVFTSGAGPASGNGSGEVMLDWISLVNQTIRYSNGQTYTKLSVGENADTCVGGGDSGGAVYQQSESSAIYAVGIISGTNGQGSLLTNCRNYFTPIGVLVADYGGSLKTSL